MSEESAFLDALKASPADDVARLAYADWLEEHNEPTKAEYLKLVVALAQPDRTAFTTEESDVRRVLQLVPMLPVEWRAAAGSRFAVTFLGCDDRAKKMSVIKRIREVALVGLLEAKRLYEQPPSTLLGWVLFEQALAARDHVLTVRGTHVQLSPADASSRPLPVLYSIRVRRHVRAEGPDETSVREEATARFAEFLQSALAITPTEAQELAQNDEVTLAEKLELAHALGLRQKLTALLPSNGLTWSIWLPGVSRALRDY